MDQVHTVGVVLQSAEADSRVVANRRKIASTQKQLAKHANTKLRSARIRNPTGDGPPPLIVNPVSPIHNMSSPNAVSNNASQCLASKPWGAIKPRSIPPAPRAIPAAK